MKIEWRGIALTASFLNAAVEKYDREGMHLRIFLHQDRRCNAGATQITTSQRHLYTANRNMAIRLRVMHYLIELRHWPCPYINDSAVHKYICIYIYMHIYTHTYKYIYIYLSRREGRRNRVAASRPCATRVSAVLYDINYLIWNC